MEPLSNAVAACFLGIAIAIYVQWIAGDVRLQLGMPANTARFCWSRGLFIVFGTIALFGLYRWAAFDLRCLNADEVQPSIPGMRWRLIYHLTLFAFLIAATAVDFDSYMIPDAVTVPGTLIGLIGACIIGEVQICHLWVDWSYAIPQLRGPYIPAWYDTHRFLHALAWSGSGLIVGALLTWVARFVSSRVLGQEAMGFGDVTLMAMIGSYIGWQAVTLVFLIAPITGLTIGVLVRMLSGKTYLPYGPWLSIAAVIVLFAWSSLWRFTRVIFSDWLSVAILASAGGGGFVLLLVLLQLYKAIPTRGTVTELRTDVASVAASPAAENLPVESSDNPPPTEL